MSTHYRPLVPSLMIQPTKTIMPEVHVVRDFADLSTRLIEGIEDIDSLRFSGRIELARPPREGSSDELLSVAMGFSGDITLTMSIAHLPLNDYGVAGKTSGGMMGPVEKFEFYFSTLGNEWNVTNRQREDMPIPHLNRICVVTPVCNWGDGAELRIYGNER